MLLVNFARELQGTFAGGADPCALPFSGVRATFRSGASSSAIPRTRWFPKSGHGGLAEDPWLFLPCLLCSDNPAAAVGVSLWFLWLQQSCRGTRNLALTPAELMEIRATTSPTKLMCHRPISARGAVGICFPRMSNRCSSLPALIPGIPAARPPSQWYQLPVPSASAVGCGLVKCCQQFPVIALLLGRAGRRKRVFVDQVVLKFDWDLLSVLWWSTAKRVVSGWLGESWWPVSNKIKNSELPSWSSVIWGCWPGSVEQISLIFNDVSLSLK